jgi:SSS family solute:Na+ symporter
MASSAPHYAFGFLDVCVIVAYLGSIWGFGLYVAFRHRRRDAGFLLDRRFSWFRVGSSIFATNITPSFLLAASAAGYATGMATANYEWLAWIFLFMLATVFAPRYLGMGITTMPEFIRKRFGDPAADFLAYYGLLIVVVLWVGGDLFVGGDCSLK